jgi:farnesyl-diphosphate farnesyltransferase
MAIADSEYAFQQEMLINVSRTFALTIPQLPPALRWVVGNAYLLCRITDTIEDAEHLTPEQKHRYHQGLIEAVSVAEDRTGWAERLTADLAVYPNASERELVRHLDRVLVITATFTSTQRAAILRCVTIMGEGMAEFEATDLSKGLADIAQLDRYCYVVAGVVGEMLTDLFCEYSAEIARHQPRLQALSVSFGLGLQMTNILKDIHDDWQRGVCWLPRAHFADYGVPVESLPAQMAHPGFQPALLALVAKAEGHLEDALAYAMLNPSKEKGIRRFLLWAVGMAFQTLKKIRQHPDFTASSQVKISRRQVYVTVISCNLLNFSNTALRGLFRLLSGRAL